MQKRIRGRQELNQPIEKLIMLLPCCTLVTLDLNGCFVPARFLLGYPFQ